MIPLDALNIGLVLLLVPAWGVLLLCLWEDALARRMAAWLLARVEGRRAYRTAYLLEHRRREMEFGVPSRKPEREQIQELEGMIRHGE